jgi:hypothetical protein
MAPFQLIMILGIVVLIIVLIVAVVQQVRGKANNDKPTDGSP